MSGPRAQAAPPGDAAVPGTQPIVTKWSSGDQRHRIEIRNPATGAVFAVIDGCGGTEADAAVRAAHAAFSGTWRQTPAARRAALLRAAAELIGEHADELARLETRENGKPYPQSRHMDMEACIGSFRFFADLIESRQPDVTMLGPIVSTEHLVPFGVVAAILPFNWPPIHFGAKVAPALAVGNSVVLKPGEQAPLTAMRLAELVGSLLPDDVLSVVPGGAEAGAALAGHPLVGMISATGSPQTGRSILASAAANLTPALLELGGKNPLIVFADADLDRAVADAVEAAFLNKGEACTAASRILVQHPIYQRFVSALARATRTIRVGDGLEPGIQVGPLVSAGQRDRVLSYLALAEAEGARTAGQALPPSDPLLAGGYFVPPTVLAEVTPAMRVAREEIFGPVTAVIPFGTTDDAIAIANNTDFGLVAGVYSSDPATVSRVTQGLEAGVIMVNNYYRNFLGTPFGGVKASGFGREHARSTLNEFGYIKSIRTLARHASLPRPFIDTTAGQ